MDQIDRILNTAFTLFTGVSYSGVTMDQIARGCGIGKATLYKYFPSKEALMLSCVDYFTGKIGAQVERIVSNPSLSPQQKVTEFFIPVVQFSAHINTAVLGDMERSVPEAYELLDQNRRRIILSTITRIVQEAKQGGIFREDLDGTLVAHILIGAVTQLCSPPVLAEYGLPVGQLLQSALSVVWEGCLSDAGRGAGDKKGDKSQSYM